MNNMMKPKKMMGGVARIPQGYKDGGKVSPAKYVAKKKTEGDMKSSSSLMRSGKEMASGSMSPEQYASSAKMNDGGLVKATGSMAPNECTYNLGPGVRSQQDYKK